MKISRIAGSFLFRSDGFMRYGSTNGATMP